MSEAVVFLERALAIDPSYAPAAAMIGRCRFFRCIQGWGSPSDAEIAEGVYLARQALEVGKDDPETLCIAAFTLSIFAGEQVMTTTAVRRALRLNPNSVHVWMTSGWNSAFLNQPGAAIETLEHSKRLSPLDPLGYLSAAGLSFARLVAHRYQEAIEWADRALEQQPCFVIPIRLKTALYRYLDRRDETRGWRGRLLELQPGLTIAKYKSLPKCGFRRNSWPGTWQAFARRDCRKSESATMRSREGVRMQDD